MEKFRLWLWIVAAAIIAFSIFVIIKIVTGPAITVPTDIAKISPADHVKGNPSAQVVLIEYSDYECPACAQFEPIIEDIIAEFGDYLVFAYRHFPLDGHENAKPAVRAAEAANLQGAFWEMHDLIFAEKDKWIGNSSPEDVFLEFAQRLGLDPDKFLKDYNSGALIDFADRTFKEALDLGLNHTPTFILNGEAFANNPTNIDVFRKIIREAIANIKDAS